MSNRQETCDIILPFYTTICGIILLSTYKKHINHKLADFVTIYLLSAYISTWHLPTKHLAEEMSMEKHEEILLEQLEAVGKEIAKCRNELTEMINSGSRINCSRLVRICRQLNEHIDIFDKIDAELSNSENIRLSTPTLQASGL